MLLTLAALLIFLTGLAHSWLGERYLLRRFRTRWNLRGVPVRLVVRGRGKGNHERP